jgi:hypothetical protein
LEVVDDEAEVEADDEKPLMVIHLLEFMPGKPG